MNPIEQTIRNYFNLLRSDITELKKCQLQYFGLSITATSAILNKSNYFNDVNNINYLIRLIPLLIVIP